jgi:hypothetical protein
MEEEAITEGAHWKMDAFAGRLMATLERFRSNQEDLLYTSDFILRQEAELNDRKRRAKEMVQREYPHVDPGLVEVGWEVLSDELKQVRAGQLTGEEADVSVTSRAKAEHKEALQSFFDKLPDDCWSEYLNSLSSAVMQSRSASHSSRLWSSLLTSVIADFEVLIGNLLRQAITQHPMIINDGEAKYTWAQITEFGDLDAFRSSQIDKTIDKLLYGSFDDWLDFLENKLHIPIPKLARDASTKEIFQRRHMIVHNGGIASAQYVFCQSGRSSRRQVW